MNELHQAFVLHLQQHPTLGPLLASPAAVFYRFAPSGQAARYVVLQDLPSPPQRHVGGRSAQQVAAYQVEGWADTGGGAKELGDVLLSVLECWRGFMGSVFVDAIYVLDVRAVTEERQDGTQDVRRCCVQLDVELWYNL